MTEASFRALVDDAAIFPPGDLPMVEALPAHHRHRAAWYADLVGPLVCSDRRLPELQQALDAADDLPTPLALSLTVSGGAGAIDPALVWAQRDDRLRVVAVEFALRDEDNLAHNATRATTVLAGSLPDDADAYLEVPRLYGPDASAGWLDALDEIAAAGHRLKFRTGGPDSDAFPSAAELATMINASLDRELEFKCTAGLHHAVRQRATDTGFEQHGFLNVLLATRAALDGANADDIAAALEDREPDSVVRGVRELGPAAVESARRWFRSFGSCSIAEPVDDLVSLGLLTGPDTAGGAR